MELGYRFILETTLSAPLWRRLWTWEVLSACDSFCGLGEVAVKGHAVLLATPLCPSDTCEGLEDFQVASGGLFSGLRRWGCLLVFVLGSSCSESLWALSQGLPFQESVCSRPFQTWPLVCGGYQSLGKPFSWADESAWKWTVCPCLSIFLGGCT